MYLVTFQNRTSSEVTVPHPVHLVLSSFRHAKVGLSKDQLMQVKSSAEIARLVDSLHLSYEIHDEPAAEVEAIAPEAPLEVATTPAETPVETAAPVVAPEAPVDAPVEPDAPVETPVLEAAPSDAPETVLSRNARKALRKAARADAAEGTTETPAESDEPKTE